MSYEKAYNYLKKFKMEKNIFRYNDSSATVELAAKAIGCLPEEIAKSITFMTSTGPIMIVCAGNTKVSNSKYKAFFGEKAKMLNKEEVSKLIGHDVGGVCPFGINDNVKVFLDLSLRDYKTIYPACGDSNSVVKLSVIELEKLANPISWIDVCTISGLLS